MSAAPDGTTARRDGRRQRGDRTRRIVLDAAVDQASLAGLDGLSFATLATSAEMSKAGVQTLFATKETLQLATIEHAATLFTEAVVTPAAAHAPGAPRLRALVESWLHYVEAPLFAGGCFWTATVAEYDSRPGPIRDALAAQQLAWRGMLAGQLRRAGRPDPDRGAFQLDAVLRLVNTELRLGHTQATDLARQVVVDLLAGCE